MKRKPEVKLFNRLKYRCPPVTFYLEDITRIIETLDVRGAKYSMSDAEYHYDSLEEIRSIRGDKVKGLAIAVRFEDGSLDSLNLEFERGAVILRSDKSEKLIVLWHVIRDILERRSTWYLRLICWPWLPYLILGPLYFIPEQTVLQTMFPIQFYWIKIAVIPSILFVALLSCLASFWQPVIYLKKEYEVESFLKRNSDKLILILISAIAGAALAAIFNKLFL